MKEHFEHVLDGPADEREARIVSRNASPSVQGEVRALLATEAELPGFLETPAAHGVFGAAGAGAPLAAGARVGDFAVVAVLGEGGGGTVYEAEQSDPRRRVALKVIRVRAHSDAAHRRFRDETAILARLQHPAIAHVYAAGVRDGGDTPQPWIAMELVRGARGIVRWAREERASRDACIRIAITVCEALHHAHENGFVHRDVTPGNVLVGADGSPKVVDFGVAHTEASPDGAAGMVVGTPAYAAPEQLEGRAADRRADVFGLGAVLHELLTGALPHDVDAMPFADAARTKRTLAVTPPHRTTRGIPRDLSAIVLRALAPEPANRYPTAAALAADLERFLADEPVHAYGGGTAYHVAKFVRRRRAAAAAIAGIGAALVGGAAVSLSFAVENARARDVAERRTYAAEIAAAAAGLRVDDAAEARRRLDRAPAALRDWEWRHLAARVDGSEEQAVLAGRELWYGAAARDGTALVTGVDRAGPGPRGTFAALVRRDGTLAREWTFRPDYDRLLLHRTGDDGAEIASWPTADVNGVPCGALSPDGARVVIGLNTGGALLCDVGSGAERMIPDAHGDRIIAARFAPQGDVFATAGKDGRARLWSWASGTLLRDFPDHGDRVICLDFDAAGTFLVTGCRDGTIRVHDAATGDVVRRLVGHEASVEGVAVSPDGTRLASASRDRTARLWDLRDGRALAVGRSHTSNVRDVAFDPSGARYATASWDGTLRIWDARTGAETGVLRGHESWVTAAGFASVPPRLVSFSRDGTLRRWDPDLPDVPTCRGLRDRARSLAFAPDGSQVAAVCGDGRLLFLDPASAAVEGAVEGAAVRSAVYTGPRQVLVSADDGPGEPGPPPTSRLEMWAAPVGARPAARVRVVAELRGIARRTLALDRGGSRVWVADAGERGIECIDVATGAVVTAQPAPTPVGALACDGRGSVVIGDHDGSVHVANASFAWRGARPARPARPARSRVLSLAFDDAGGRIAAAFDDGTICVLRRRDLAVLHVLEGHSAAVHQAAFLPGGRRIASVSHDLTARLWDAETGDGLLVLHGHGYPVECLAVAPDGARLATGGGSIEDEQSTIRIWAAPFDAR